MDHLPVERRRYIIETGRNESGKQNFCKFFLTNLLFTMCTSECRAAGRPGGSVGILKTF